MHGRRWYTCDKERVLRLDIYNRGLRSGEIAEEEAACALVVKRSDFGLLN